MLVGDVLAARRPLAGLREFLRAVDAQQAGAVGLGDDAGPRLGEDGVAVGVVAVVVRVEDVADRLVGGLLDGRDDVAGLLGEVGVEDDDVILEDDPDVIAAAEEDRFVGGADGGVAEEDAGRDFADLVELHLRRLVGAVRGSGDSKEGDKWQATAHGDTPRRGEGIWFGGQCTAVRGG